MRKVGKSCYLVGEDLLVMQCGEILISQGYFIKGILSPRPEVQKWATDNNVTHYTTYQKFEMNLLEEHCDYLFSIANSQIISSTTLTKVRRLAINYHDAPLPGFVA